MEDIYSTALFDNLYVGSFYDARLEQKGWDTELFDDVSWQHAKLTAAPAPLIEAQKMPSITTADTLSVVSVNCISDTCYVFDMGINTAGVPRLEIKGERGTRIRLRHSEMLQKDGNIDQRILTCTCVLVTNVKLSRRMNIS